ncbi:MAG: sigma-70 family RNA polymerase sigma factor [Planctomycetota bacterium]
MSPHEKLMQQDEWIRSIARALTRDEHVADDLVQETYLAAMHQPPTQGERLRAWVRRVLLNGLRQRHRSEGRRRRREECSARPEHTVERCPIAEAEARKLLRDSIAELPPPYQDLIRARYEDGTSAADIAAHTHVSLETIKWRLRRARALLREKLERRFPDGQWPALLLPLCALPSIGSAARSPRTTAGSSNWSSSIWIGRLQASTLASVTAAAILIVTVAMLPDGESASPEASASSPGTTRDVAMSAHAAPERTAWGTRNRGTPADPISAARTTQQHGTSPLAHERDAKTTAVRGTLQIVNDPDSDEQREVATFQVTPVDSHRAPLAAVQHCKSADGTWEIQVPTATAGLRVEQLRIGSRFAYVPRHHAAVPADGDIDLLAYWYTPRTLHVHSRDGLPLQGVRVLQAHHLTNAHPMEATPLRQLHAGNSPLRLPDYAAGAVWIGADGYAWRRIELEHDQPEERAVVLAPGTSLTIQADSSVADPSAGAEIALFLREGSSPASRIGATPFAMDVEITGLEPGRYEVRAGWPPDYAHGSAWVDVSSQPAVVALDVIPAHQTPLPIHGRLRVPEAFAQSMQLLTIHDADDPTSATDHALLDNHLRALSPDRLTADAMEPGWFDFTTRLPEGRYRFRLDSVSLPGVHTVRSGHENTIELTLPQLADVTLTVTDTTDRQCADVELIVWFCSEEGQRPLAGHPVRRRPTADGFRFRAPLGPITIATVRTPTVGRYVIRPGHNEIELVVGERVAQLERK